MAHAPPFGHLDGLPGPLTAFHLGLPFDSPPLNVTCSGLPRDHPPTSVFPQSPFKWLLLGSTPHQGWIWFPASSVQHVASLLPSKAERLGAPARKAHLCLLALAGAAQRCPGVPMSQSAFLPDESPCSFLWGLSSSIRGQRKEPGAWSLGLHPGPAIDSKLCGLGLHTPDRVVRSWAGQ